MKAASLKGPKAVMLCLRMIVVNSPLPEVELLSMCGCSYYSHTDKAPVMILSSKTVLTSLHYKPNLTLNCELVQHHVEGSWVWLYGCATGSLSMHQVIAIAHLSLGFSPQSSPQAQAKYLRNPTLLAPWTAEDQLTDRSPTPLLCMRGTLQQLLQAGVR